MLMIVRFWILLSAALVSAGWILSALHQLNGVGYALFLTPLLIAVLVARPKSDLPVREKIQRWRARFTQRFRRRPAQMFLLFAVLSFLGGCLYPPLSVDANAYRLPRILHWLAAGQWHWIHTFEARMNISACGMEWLSAPLILLTHTDRFLFLINFVSYLMLPGLLFSVFTRLQVRPRTAWWWTWILSSGLCFVLQAGSIVNDSFAVVYILAAVDLALRARERKNAGDLWLSLLAAGLVTGAKQSNIPLAALWFIAAWPARSLLWQNPWRSAAVFIFSLLVSVIPISLINQHFSGTWLPLDNPSIAALGHFQLNPFWGIVGNAFCLPVQNLVPPFYSWLPPLYSYAPILWDEWMRDFLQTPFGAHFASFEKFGFLSEAYYHGISEANAGLGLGICLMIWASWRALRQLRREGQLTGPAIPASPVLRRLRFAPWGLLIVFAAKNGAFENARHLAPYYPFLFTAWLVKPGHSRVTRQRSWQNLALATMIVAALLLATIVERPLFPAQTVFRFVRSHFSNSDLLQDECVHYLDSISQGIAARRNFIRQQLPAGEKVIGFYDKMTDTEEPGIWFAGGRPRVECQLPDDSPDRLRHLGVRYVVVDAIAVQNHDGNLDHWLQRYHATVIAQYPPPNPTVQPARRADLYIVQLN